ncbi:MAG TPA: DEAD/DEAH box helicase [Acidimicrobiia bacterium]
MSATFEGLGLPTPIVTALSRRGITDPFPIQGSAIPHGLAGRDMLGRAPTGSGKTLAFGLPLLTRVTRADPGRPRALILAPTRELAAQINRDLAPLGETLGVRSTVVHGGVSYQPQKKALRVGVDVLIATPGRLEDLIEQRSVDLSQVEIVVLDEADRMADMGFMPAVRRIVLQTNDRRQTHLFSATLGGEVSVLSKQIQQDPVKVSADANPSTEPKADHHFWRVGRSDRLEHAARVIEASQRTLVFTRTRHGADRLAKQLGRSQVPAAAMHGGRSQSQRTRVLRAFANGEVSALVATDVAARGIHVDDIDVVLHYDLANDHTEYVHRSGRTARAGATGTVISLVVEGQDRDVRKIQQAINMSAPIEAPNKAWIGTKRRSSETNIARPERSGQRGETRLKTRPSPDGESLRIYVGNLPWRTTAGDLEELFAKHGQVESSRISTQEKSGRSKGFGFVDMPQPAGRAAIDAMNGFELHGRTLRVRVAW